MLRSIRYITQWITAAVMVIIVVINGLCLFVQSSSLSMYLSIYLYLSTDLLISLVNTHANSVKLLWSLVN